MALKEIQELNSIRIENTRKLINDKYVTISNLAKALDKSVSYLSHLLAGNRTFTEKTARELETVLGLESFSLDQNCNGTEVGIAVYNTNTAYHSVLSSVIMGYNKINLSVIYVNDDAMLPILECGQGVVFDKSNTTISTGKIYVLSINNNIVVRKLYKDIITNKIMLKSSNIIYPDTEIEDTNQFEILGVVIAALEKTIK